MLPCKTNTKQTGRKQRYWQLRPTKGQNVSKKPRLMCSTESCERTDATHLCEPETLGCWSSFSAWFKAMTLSPRAKATKALQARIEHLDMRGQSLINSGLDTMAERWQVCWREQRINKDKSTSRRSLYLRFSISCFLSGDDGAADRILSASCHFPLWWKIDNKNRLFSTQLVCTEAL